MRSFDGNKRRTVTGHWALRTVMLGLLIAAHVPAQISTASLTGILSDPSQGRIPGAVVELTNEETGVVATTRTGSQGEYTIALLPPGRYRLAASASGFQGYSRSGIVLEIGRVMRLDFAMQVGSVTEVLEVTGAVPLLESENATLSQLIENKTIIDMPLNGRRVGDLAVLLGHTVLVQPNVNFPRIAVGGGRADSLAWLMDGVTANNASTEVPQTDFNPPVEAMQEFRIMQNNYSAEFGNTSSGVISFSTKSGTNEFHGSAYEYLRNDELDARNFFSSTKAPLRYNIFGFTAGGPVLRNKTFFFVSTEWQRQNVGVTRTLTVPTETQRAGDFSQTVDARGVLIRVYDPATTRPNPANANQMIRDQFPNNVIPASRIDPVGKNIAALFPLPNRPAANLAGANNFARNASTLIKNTALTTRVDHVFGSNDRLTGRFVMYDFPQKADPVFDEPAADPFGFTSFPREYSMLLNEIHNFSPTTINDFRFNWKPRRFRNQALGLEENWPDRLGLQGVANIAFPRVASAGYTAMGRPNQVVIHNPVRDAEFINQFAWFRGAHTVKFGGTLRFTRFQLDESRLVSGQLSFGTQPTGLPNTGGTGNSIASMLVGFPNDGTIQDQDLLDRRQKYIALFVQDDWKATPVLTLNLGLRWETHTPRIDTADKQSGFDVSAINPISGTPGVVTFARVNGMGRTVYEGDYNNFGPRIGLAWRPFGSGRTVIRTGYGIFFGQPFASSNIGSAGFETAGSFTTPDSGITAPFLLRAGFPPTEREELGPGFGAVAVGQPVRYAPQYFDPARRLSYSQQWNFAVQRELGGNSVLEVSYLGSVGHKLPGPDTSINQVRPELMGPGNAQVRRPYPQFGNVTVAWPMWGNSSYHSMNIKVEKRFSHGLNFLTNYTYAKFIDDVVSRVEVGQVGGGFQDFYNRRADKSLSGNDVRNRFVWSSVYELPVGQGRRWLSKGPASVIVGGWDLGVILLLQQGSPFGLVTQTNTTNAFNSGSQRVNVLRDPTLPDSQRSLNRWFDTEAVAAPAAFTFGNSGRALLTGPGLATVDMSLLKNHRWRERLNVEFRFEAFNLLNRANFEEPGRAFGSAGFGVISASRAARILQLGLKLEF